MKDKDIKNFVREYYELNNDYKFNTQEDRKELALLKAFSEYIK